MYRKEARKNYLKLAKCKKRSIKKIRATIRKQQGYVKRNMGFLEGFIKEGYPLTPREAKLVGTIYKVYQQQESMYRNKTHSVPDRIVSISQPYLRPIVRGKVKSPVEFGAKFDVSIVDGGFARIEKLSFDPYNESTCLEETTLTSISLSIFVMNLFKVSLCPFLKWAQKSKIQVILLLTRPGLKLRFA